MQSKGKESLLVGSELVFHLYGGEAFRGIGKSGPLQMGQVAPSTQKHAGVAGAEQQGISIVT